MPGTTVFIAWLRAINVGGNRMVKMDALKRIFTKLGGQHVRTLINSGNVVFAYEKIAETALRKRIETTLEEQLGFDVTTIVRTHDELQALVDAQPFATVEMTDDTRLYVTFLAETPTAAQWKALKAAETPTQQFLPCGRELCTVYRKDKAVKEPFSNTLIEKVLGTRATTRGWPTVQKMLALSQKK